MGIKGLTPTDEKAKVKLQCARAIPLNAQAGEVASLGVPMDIKQLTATVALAALASANAMENALAQTIYLGLQEYGYNSNQIAVESAYTTDADNLLLAGIKFGSFKIIGVTSTGDAQDPDTGFGSTVNATVNVKSSATKTLNVYLSEVGVAGVTGNIGFTSILTNNGIPAGWTVVESTYVNPDDKLFGTEDLLSTTTFTSEGATTSSKTLTLIPPYSVTEVYSFTVSANSLGSVLATEKVTDPAVPEASTWAMMLAGFAGLGFAGHRRKRAAAHAA
jgi:hypothetical protein